MVRQHGCQVSQESATSCQCWLPSYRGSGAPLYARAWNQSPDQPISLPCTPSLLAGVGSSAARVHAAGQVHSTAYPPLLIPAVALPRSVQRMPTARAGNSMNDHPAMEFTAERDSFLTFRNSQGDSFFARILRVWLPAEASAQPYRDRAHHLTGRLADKVQRVLLHRRAPRILNLDCGPELS